MAREEIIERLENIAEHAIHKVGENSFILSLDDGIAIHEAIEVLKSEPCEDAVSRQAVIDLVRKKQHSREYCIEHNIDFSIDVGAFNVGISSLPSVKPTRVKGRWIDCAERDVWFRCSECRERVYGSHHNFCPNCGAYMRGDEE